MFHNRLQHLNTHRGSMLVMALFVIIVLSLLGLAIIQILSDSSRSVSYDVYGARAFNAANSGIELRLAEIFDPSAGDRCALETTNGFDLPDISSFHECKVSVHCRPFSINHSEYKYTHYQVTSTATCTVGDFITERTVAIEARIRQ